MLQFARSLVPARGGQQKPQGPYGSPRSRHPVKPQAGRFRPRFGNQGTTAPLQGGFGKLDGCRGARAPAWTYAETRIMKRSERHHLKENPLATFLAELSETIWVNTRAVTGAARRGGRARPRRCCLWLAAVPFVTGECAPCLGDGDCRCTGRRDETARVDRSRVRAAELPGEFPSVAAKLETAVPRLLEAADAYPGFSQGIAARYQAAVALGVLGRTEEADAQYQQVMELDGDGMYARMARLGRAEALVAHGRPRRRHRPAGRGNRPRRQPTMRDCRAIALLMRLGQVYVLAGQSAEAASTFRQLIDEFPASAYRFEAQRELDTLPLQGDG